MDSEKKKAPAERSARQQLVRKSPETSARRSSSALHRPKRESRRRSVFGYAAGSLSLGLAVAAAFFWPVLYNRWQDQTLSGTVRTESRDTIEFIDTSALDRAGRMKMLSQVTWAEVVYFADAAWLGNTTESTVSTWREKVAQWVDCGLLPGYTLDMAAEEQLVSSTATLLLNTDQGTLTIENCMFGWRVDETYSEMVGEIYDSEAAGCWQTLSLYMDAETGMLYAAILTENNSAAGTVGFGGTILEPEALENWSEETDLYHYLAEQIGYDTYEEAVAAYYESVQSDAAQMERAELDPTLYDFATPCGADSAAIDGVPGTLSLDIELSYDTFTGKAYRRVFSDNTLAVMYGSLVWAVDAGLMTTTDTLLFGDSGTWWADQELEFLSSCEDPFMDQYLADAGITAAVSENYGGDETAIEADAAEAEAPAE